MLFLCLLLCRRFILEDKEDFVFLDQTQIPPGHRFQVPRILAQTLDLLLKPLVLLFHTTHIGDDAIALPPQLNDLDQSLFTEQGEIPHQEDEPYQEKGETLPFQLGGTGHLSTCLAGMTPHCSTCGTSLGRGAKRNFLTRSLAATTAAVSR